MTFPIFLPYFFSFCRYLLWSFSPGRLLQRLTVLCEDSQVHLVRAPGPHAARRLVLRLRLLQEGGRLLVPLPSALVPLLYRKPLAALLQSLS